MSDWISVEDRLPKNGQMVDVWHLAGRHCDVEYIDGDFHLYYEEMGETVDCDVINPTHWMPIPGGPNA